MAAGPFSPTDAGRRPEMATGRIYAAAAPGPVDRSSRWAWPFSRAPGTLRLSINRVCTMGLLDGLLGNASKIDPAQIQQEFAQVLAPGERIEHAYKLMRDYFVFTDKRFVIVDRQGLTGSKVEYHSIPYRSITHFSVETAGSFDLDAELRIWIAGSPVPVQKQFNRQLSIYEVQAVLASYVLR
jgi:hypothetical protein